MKAENILNLIEDKEHTLRSYGYSRAHEQDWFCLIPSVMYKKLIDYLFKNCVANGVCARDYESIRLYGFWLISCSNIKSIKFVRDL